MKTTTERATPVPTLVLMKARHLCGESRGASSPKSNQSKQVQVTSLACVPDRCQATQKDTNPRGDHEPTTMTNLHPVTLLTNFALNFAYIKTTVFFISLYFLFFHSSDVKFANLPYLLPPCRFIVKSLFYLTMLPNLDACSIFARELPDHRHANTHSTLAVSLASLLNAIFAICDCYLT